MRLTLKLTGTSPLLMHNPRMVDPNFDLNREIKALTVAAAAVAERSTKNDNN